MAEDEDDVHPGLDALVNCNGRVKNTIRNHLDDIADYLRKKDIIDLALYNEVTNPRPLETEEIRAALVYRRLQNMVQGDENYFLIFMKYLRKYPQKFKKITIMLDRAYGENGGRISDNPNPNTLEPIPKENCCYTTIGFSISAFFGGIIIHWWYESESKKEDWFTQREVKVTIEAMEDSLLFCLQYTSDNSNRSERILEVCHNLLMKAIKIIKSTSACDRGSYKDVIGNGNCVACPFPLHTTASTAAPSLDNCNVCRYTGGTYPTDTGYSVGPTPSLPSSVLSNTMVTNAMTSTLSSSTQVPSLTMTLTPFTTGMPTNPPGLQAPGRFTATLISDTMARLSWQAVTGARGYRVAYQSTEVVSPPETSPVIWERIIGNSVLELRIILQPNSNYSFTIAAVDTRGVIGQMAEPQVLETPEANLPRDSSVIGMSNFFNHTLRSAPYEHSESSLMNSITSTTFPDLTRDSSILHIPNSYYDTRMSHFATASSGFLDGGKASSGGFPANNGMILFIAPLIVLLCYAFVVLSVLMFIGPALMTTQIRRVLTKKKK